MKKYLQTLHSSKLFYGITEEEIEKMLSCLRGVKKEYEKDEFIYHQGETTSSAGIILSGNILVIEEDIWGNRNIISRLGAAETFGLAYSTPSFPLNVSVVADTPVSILFIDMKGILTVCSSACTYHTRLIRNLVGELAEKNLKLSEKLTHITQRSTRAKLMSYLSSLAQKKGKYEFDIPFSRQELADYLAVERSGLSSEMARMQKEGLIEYNKNHFILKMNSNELD